MSATTDTLDEKSEAQHSTGLITQHPSNDNIVSPLYADFFALLHGTQQGHMARHAFTNSESGISADDGLQAWGKVVADKNFPANRERQIVTNPETITRIFEEISSGIGRRNPDLEKAELSFIEIGPGLWPSVDLKTTPYIRGLAEDFTAQSLDPKLQAQQYIAIDTTRELAVKASEGILGTFPNLCVSHHEGRFENLGRLKTLGTPVAMSWGGTLWNVGLHSDMDTTLTLTNSIKSVGKLVGSGGFAIFTHYPVHSAKEEEEIYKSAANIRAVESILHTIEANLQDHTNFRAENFDIKVDYDRQLRRIVMKMASKQNHTVTLGNSVSRDFSTDEELILVNSWKPKFEEIATLASQAGAEVRYHTQDRRNSSAIALLQFN